MKIQRGRVVGNTEFKPDISRADQDFDLVVDFEVMLPQTPEASVLFFELRLVRAREVGFDFAEDMSI